MKKLWIALAALTALGAGTASASNPGELTVRDPAKVFTAEGIKAAKTAFASHSYDSPTKVLVVTHEGVPSKTKAEWEKLKDKSEKDRFIGEWTRNEAKAEGAKGIFILVSTNPNYVRVIASEQMRADRSFGEAKVGRMQELLVDAFRASKDLKDEAQKQGHDVGLTKALEYAGEQLKGTAAVSTTATHGPAKVRSDKGGTGMGVLGWVCLIGVVLLGVWLVVGLLRAVTGMGGGGGGGYGPGGGGYGGGGGGFMSSLMGGMFGSMAGMWMYNNVFGGGMSSMSAGDYGGGGATGGDYGGGAVGGDDGNFDNGADAGGGDWGGGDTGGGDFGGGDFGGGGGDFGGGGDW